MTNKRNLRSRRADTPTTAPSPNQNSNQRHYGEGYRGEIYSRHLKDSNGTSYFFNLKENREANIYLNIVESRSLHKPQTEHRESPRFQRHSILIFTEQRQAFAAECLAGLEALVQGQNYRASVNSIQRQFSLQVRPSKQSVLSLLIREDGQHYGKPLQNQIQVPQRVASHFSQALIEVLEKWLDSEKQQKHVPPKIERKKVVALRPVTPNHMNHADHSGDNGSV